MIKICGLSHAYGKRKVLDNLSFTIREGEIFGILGPNGAGKSTLLNILITLIRQNEGHIEINGIDNESEPQTIRMRLGVVFQDSTLDERLTVGENLYFHARLYGVRKREISLKIKEALLGVGLERRVGELVMNLSGGMKRRLEIARALTHEPKILVLDEPTTGLDPQSRNQIWEKIRRLNRESGTTVLLSTHYLEEAETCHRVAIIDQGKLTAIGSPDEIRMISGHDAGSLQSAFLSLTGASIRDSGLKDDSKVRELVRERKLF